MLTLTFFILVSTAPSLFYPVARPGQYQKDWEMRIIWNYWWIVSAADNSGPLLWLTAEPTGVLPVGITSRLHPLSLDCLHHVLSEQFPLVPCQPHVGIADGRTLSMYLWVSLSELNSRLCFCSLTVINASVISKLSLLAKYTHSQANSACYQLQSCE